MPAARESSRQAADPKHRQLLPSSQLEHPGGGGATSGPGPAFVSPPWAPDRAGASHGPSRQKAQSALEVVRPLDRSIAQAKPLLSKQIQLQCSCCCSEQPGWELEYQLGQGAQLHSSSLPLFAIAATLPGAFRAGALLPGALLPSPWQ